MSLSGIRNVVLLFSNPVWTGSNTVPTTIIRNVTALSSQIAYQANYDQNLTTLSTRNAETLDGVIQGLLYVPELPADDPCAQAQFDEPVQLPLNLTHRSNLPPRTTYKVIAIAPWFNQDCTRAYLAAAQFDPVRAFLFFRPNNSTNKPQGVDWAQWDLGDDGTWLTESRFPVFAIPGDYGREIVQALSDYSGAVQDVPYSKNVTDLFGPHPKDYVRIWTELTIKGQKSSPAMGVFVVVVIGALLFIVACVSLVMHLIQRRRRKSLTRRVQSGEVDLEASGITRVVVPADHIISFPLFTYNSEPERFSIPSTPVSPTATTSPRSLRSSRHADRNLPDGVSASGRKRRASFADTDCTAAGTNNQPTCEICLEPFGDRVSVIRQLPCFHIFHPECIDEFLGQNSSLCPLCKQCMLPCGYSPRITNTMVRRERIIRRLRATVRIDDEEEKGKSKSSKRISLSHSITTPGAVGTLVKPPGRDSENPQLPKRSGRPLDLPSTLEETTATLTGPDGGPGRQGYVAGQPAGGERKRSQRHRPRALSLQETQPRSPLTPHQPGGRINPSDVTRARMRALAGSAFVDPDSQRPRWKRAMNKVFPSLF